MAHGKVLPSTESAPTKRHVFVLQPENQTTRTQQLYLHGTDRSPNPDPDPDPSSALLAWYRQITLLLADRIPFTWYKEIWERVFGSKVEMWARKSSC